jgi:type II secretory pathway component PulF
MAVSGKDLARWYREIAQSLRAGYPLQKALLVAGGAPVRARRRFAEQLARGDPWKDVLHGAPHWLPTADRHILAASAESGRLVEGLQILSEKHAFAAEQRGKAVGAMIYPLFIVHFGILLVPVRLVLTHDVATYLRLVGSLLLPLWAILFLIIWGARGRHRWLQFLLRMLPLVRGYVKNRSVADLCFTLASYLASGEGIDHAWLGAAQASGDRRLMRLGKRIATEARHGTSPGETLERTGTLPEEFVSLYTTGEQTGQLEENLHYLRVIYGDRAAAKLQQAGFWYPMFMVITVAFGVAYVAITSYMHYLEDVLRILEM